MLFIGYNDLFFTDVHSACDIQKEHVSDNASPLSNKHCKLNYMSKFPILRKQYWLNALNHLVFTIK